MDNHPSTHPTLAVRNHSGLHSKISVDERALDDTGAMRRQEPRQTYGGNVPNRPGICSLYPQPAAPIGSFYYELWRVLFMINTTFDFDDSLQIQLHSNRPKINGKLCPHTKSSFTDKAISLSKLPQQDGALRLELHLKIGQCSLGTFFLTRWPVTFP